MQVEGAIDDSRFVLAELRRFRETPWIKAVVVRIDSPGGAVAPTQEIFEEIQKTKKQKALHRIHGQHRGVRRVLHRQRLQ